MLLALEAGMNKPLYIPPEQTWNEGKPELDVRVIGDRKITEFEYSGISIRDVIKKRSQGCNMEFLAEGETESWDGTGNEWPCEDCAENNRDPTRQPMAEMEIHKVNGTAGENILKMYSMMCEIRELKHARTENVPER